MLRLATCVALLCSGLAAQQTPRFYDPQGRFSLQPPAGWTTQRSPDGNVVFTDPSSRITLGVAPTAFDGPATLPEASAAFQRLLQARPGLSVERMGDEELQLAGQSACRSSYRLRAGNSTIRLEATFVLQPNLLLTLSASVPETQFAQHRDTIHEAIASLQFGGGKPATAPARGDLERKLAALEAAHAAGVITDAEFTQKKAALLRTAQPDPDIAAKLDALEKAHAAGVISDAELTQKKAVLLHGRAPGESPATTVATPAELPTRPAHKGSIYQHPIGFQLWHPEGWKVEAQEGLLRLLPPDPDGGEDAPNEVYLLIGDSVEGEGIDAPDHPAVTTYLDDQVHSISQALTRQGRPTAVPMARGTGARYEWRAQLEGQPEVTARAFTCIINGYGVALLGIGFPNCLDRREDTLRQIFASFGFGAGKKDPALVGSWTLVSTVSLDNTSPLESSWSRARMVKDTTSTLTFRADGHWQRVDAHHMLAMGAGVSLEDKGQKQSQGTWNAADGGLFMIWQDKTWEDYRYELEQTGHGPVLRLISGNVGQVWQRD